MPNSGGTSRTKLEEKDLGSKFPVAPISVVQFFGESRKDVDVNLRAKKGLFLSHWPASTDARAVSNGSGRSSPRVLPRTSRELPPGRTSDPETPPERLGLYLKHESHYERFIAYDAEVAVPVPVKIRGGPDEYTLQNLTGRKLIDVAVIRRQDRDFASVGSTSCRLRPPKIKMRPMEGKAKPPLRRTSLNRRKTPPLRRRRRRLPRTIRRLKRRMMPNLKKTAAEKADDVFKDAEAKKKPEEEAIPPLPAEGDERSRHA